MYSWLLAFCNFWTFEHCYTAKQCKFLTRRRAQTIHPHSYTAHDQNQNHLLTTSIFTTQRYILS